MRFLLVIREPAAKAEAPSVKPKAKAGTGDEPDDMLKCHGYRVFASNHEREIRQKIANADAAILKLPLSGISSWSTRLSEWKALPLFWWCDAQAAATSLESCEDDIPVDGILAPSMSAHELHWALHLGSKHFFERRQWLDERAQLVSRLEERKWIDLAKGILCRVNGISEAEAYEALRKRAMNERKRIADIAVLIVKAHQQLKM